MTDAEQVAQIRFLVIATGLIEDEEFSTIELVGKLCERLKGISNHMEACRVLLNVPDDDVLYEGIAHLLDSLREAVKRLKAHNDPGDQFWVQGIGPLLK